MLSDILAMRWQYWRYAVDAAMHHPPWKWLIPRAIRKRVCDWYEAWLTEEGEK